MKYRHRKKRKFNIFPLLYIFFGTVAAVSLFLIGFDIYVKVKTENGFDKLASLYESDENEMSDDEYGINDNGEVVIPDGNDADYTDGYGDDSTETTGEKKKSSYKIPRNLEKLKELNKECVGWICIKNTMLNYPLMYSPSSSGKYLKTGFYGEKSSYGVPYISSDCTLDSTNLIIYGHDMNNNTMFGSLKGYLKSSYWKSHPTVEIELESGKYEYKIFAAVRVKMTDNWYSCTNFKSAKSFDEQIAILKKNALYDTGITPKYGDKLITLSTCYGKGEVNRLIVVAVRTK